LNVPAEALFAALAARLREKHSIVTRIHAGRRHARNAAALRTGIAGNS